MEHPDVEGLLDAPGSLVIFLVEYLYTVHGDLVVWPHTLDHTMLHETSVQTIDKGKVIFPKGMCEFSFHSLLDFRNWLYVPMKLNIHHDSFYTLYYNN